jgi:hypothetical protein
LPLHHHTLTRTCTHAPYATTQPAPPPPPPRTTPPALRAALLLCAAEAPRQLPGGGAAARVGRGPGAVGSIIRAEPAPAAVDCRGVWQPGFGLTHPPPHDLHTSHPPTTHPQTPQAAYHDWLLASGLLTDEEAALLHWAGKKQDTRMRARFKKAAAEGTYRKATALEALVSLLMICSKRSPWHAASQVHLGRCRGVYLRCVYCIPTLKPHPTSAAVYVPRRSATSTSPTAAGCGSWWSGLWAAGPWGRVRARLMKMGP